MDEVLDEFRWQDAGMVAREMRIILNLIYLQVLFHAGPSGSVKYQIAVCQTSCSERKENDPEFVQSLGRGR